MDGVAHDQQALKRVATRDSAIGRRIAQQLDSNIDGHTPSGDAFVVSVYGEWGIGKTYCLEAVREIFQDRLDAAIAAIAAGVAPPKLIVPVFFDPWRFEHEEHLVVPLLKTIEHDLRRVLVSVQKAETTALRAASTVKQACATVLAKLKRAARVFGDVAVALATSFKFKLAPLKELTGIEAEFEPGKGLDYLEKVAEREAAAKAAEDPLTKDWPATSRIATAAKRESLYFDTQAALEALTEDAENETSLRLVVLIDDLDRCLPEKAVQILESIKLFLNVPGFSFVLAVDDEIVERGIAHRYRDYLAPDSAGQVGCPPISGAEYLEKIVHLPVHLHRWTEDEARQYLRDHYASLFAPPAPSAATARDPLQEREAKSDRSAPANIEADAVLTTLVHAVPLVPRKLIRLAEGMLFQRSHIVAVGETENLRLAHLARIVAVQQLYPSLYRFLRSQDARYWRLFETSIDPFNDPVYQGSSVSILKNTLDSRKDLAKTADSLVTSTTGNIREQYELLALVAQATEQRGAPNPLRLFRQPDGEKLPEGTTPEEIAAGFTYIDFHRLYVHGLKPIRAPARPRAAPDQRLPVSNIVNAAAFLDTLLDPDHVGRGSALQASGAIGQQLPDTVFDALIARLDEPAHAARIGDLGWLKDVASVTSTAQMVTLYNRHKVLDNLLQQNAPPASESPR